jgi:outer membrane protein assembly factor BamB
MISPRDGCRKRVAVVLLALFAAACGNRKDTTEPPAELVSFEEALDVRKLWSSKVGRGTERLRLGLRPASDGIRVYAGAYNGNVAAFDAATGRKIWSVETDLALSAGPGLANGVLAFGSSDGVLLALEAETGNELWRVPVISEILAAPAVGANVVVARTVDGGLRGHAIDDGRQLWLIEQDLGPLVLRGNTAPQIAGSIVVAGFDNGRVGAYELGTGDALWEIPVGVPSGRGELARLVDVGAAGLQIVSTGGAARVYAVGYNGRVVAIDLATGFEFWEQELSSYAGLGADVANVYVTTNFDAIVALGGGAGTQQWRQEALRLRDVTPATRFGSAVVVGDYEGYLHWLNAEDGSLLARERATSDRVTAAPLVVGTSLIAQGDDGSLVAFAIEEEEPEEIEPEPEDEDEDAELAPELAPGGADADAGAGAG